MCKDYTTMAKTEQSEISLSSTWIAPICSKDGFLPNTKQPLSLGCRETTDTYNEGIVTVNSRSIIQNSSEEKFHEELPHVNNC